jgi:ketosteroid isomerase-like protein
MAELSSREVIDRYVRAMGEGDVEVLPALIGDDIVEDYPQSGERIAGLQNWLAIIRNWPEDARSHIDRVVGSEDEWVAGPNWSITHLVGTGDQYWGTGHVRYPDGSVWHIVQLIELKHGKIARLTSYFAAPFEAAEWRKPWVTQIPRQP